MKSIRIKYTAITKIGFNKFLTITRIIQQGLEKHADIFNSPPVSTQALGEALKNLSTKVSIASDGSRKAKNERNIQKSVVLNMLMMNGAYVIGVANTKNTFEEKAAIVQMAGYTVAEGPNKRVGPIRAAYYLKAYTPSTPWLGWVDLRWKRGSKGAYSFSIQAKQGTGSWKTMGTSRNTRFKLTGLKPGIWSFRVIAQGTAGSADPSGQVIVMVG